MKNRTYLNAKSIVFTLAAFLIMAPSKGAYLEDVVNQKRYSYTHIKKQMEENACIDYKNLIISVPQFVSMSDTSVQSKINRSIYSLMIDKLNQVTFRYKLTNHAINAEVAYLKYEVEDADRMVTCDINQSLYAPSINRVNYNFSQLYHDIVALSVTYTYSASVKNSKRLVDLRYISTVYINLTTGKEYSLSDVFKPNSFKSIDKLIQSKYSNGSYYTWNSEFNLSDNYYDYDYDEGYEEAAEGYDEMEADAEDYTSEMSEEADYEGDYAYEDYDEEVVEEAAEEAVISDYSPYERFKNRSSRSQKNKDGLEVISPNSNYSRTLYSSKKGRELLDFAFHKNGLALFNAASFTFIVPAFQPCNDQGYGRCVAMRLSLSELQPFLNPNGPFAGLIQEKTQVTQNYYETIAHIETMNKSLNLSGYDISEMLKMDSTRTVVQVRTKNTRFGSTVRINGMNTIDTAKTRIVMEFTFEKGQMVSKKTFRNNGQIRRIEHFAYNDGDKLVKYTSGNGYSTDQTILFNYDMHGNLLKKEVLNNGALNHVVYYDYRGNNVFEERFHENYVSNDVRKLTRNAKQYYDTAISYSSSGATKTTYHYDSLNNVITSFNTGSHDLNNLVYRNFDQKNRLIATGNNRTLFEYAYDENDKLISHVYRRNDHVNSIKTYVYDSNNSLIEFKIGTISYSVNYMH